MCYCVMSSEESKKPDVGCSSRDVSISRRGGVRTRGGRLPPISIRDINQVMGTKKVLVPNVPRRRAVVKSEESQRTSMDARRVKEEPGTDSSRPRRNRPAKVLLQTGGTFLAEGPAARIKRDTVGLDLSFSSPRVSARKVESEIKYDSEMIKNVLTPYDANSFYEDYDCDIPPIRFPPLKQKPIIKIKSEPDDDDDDSVKMKIKSEVKEEETIITTPKTDSKKAVDVFRDIKNDGMLILLKLPTCLPFMKQAEVTSSDDNDQKDSKIVKDDVVGKEMQEEGLIGKMRFMRSGRMKLVLGEIELEVTDESPSESYMEAAAITVQGDAADVNILGKVEWRMVFSPTADGLVT